jgi:hypothetical protein
MSKKRHEIYNNRRNGKKTVNSKLKRALSTIVNNVFIFRMSIDFLPDDEKALA